MNNHIKTLIVFCVGATYLFWLFSHGFEIKIKQTVDGNVKISTPNYDPVKIKVEGAVELSNPSYNPIKVEIRGKS